MAEPVGTGRRVGYPYYLLQKLRQAGAAPVYLLIEQLGQVLLWKIVFLHRHTHEAG